MVNDRDSGVARILRSYAAHRGLSESYASRLLAGSGITLSRLDAGGGLTVRRANAILQRASDRWPADLPWPDDIPRPALSPDSSAATPDAPTTRRGRRQAVLAARERMHDAVTAGDWEAAQAHERTMLEAALTCRAGGQIADPESLCLALRTRRYVYDDVVRRYAGGRNRRPPRRGSSVERMVRALRAAGDVRFRSPAASPVVAAAAGVLAGKGAA